MGGRLFMDVAGSVSASSRRMFVTLGMVTVLGVASPLFAQTPPAQTPPAQAPAQPPDQMLFPADVPAAMIVYAVKPDKTADFESFWSTVKSKVAASTKEDVKATLTSLKFFKVQADPAAAAQGATYIFYIDPPAKTTYNPIGILYQSGIFERAEADQLYAKIKDSINQIVVWPLTKVGG